MCKETLDVIFHGAEAAFSGMLVLVTAVLAIFTYRLVTATQGVVKATQDLFVETKEAAKKQLGVNTWMNYTERWDRKDLRQKRKENAQVITHDKNYNQTDPVLDFFEQIGILFEKECIDHDLVHSSFSYDAQNWWVVLKDYVNGERDRTKDKSYYTAFEEMVGVLHKMHPEDPVPTPEEAKAYLKEESELL